MGLSGATACSSLCLLAARSLWPVRRWARVAGLQQLVSRRRADCGPSVAADKTEVHLYLQAKRLADELRAVAGQIVALDACGDTRPIDLMCVHEARAACSEPAACQLASLLLLGARHKSVLCRSSGTCRFGDHCCFMHGDYDRCDLGFWQLVLQ